MGAHIFCVKLTASDASAIPAKRASDTIPAISHLFFMGLLSYWFKSFRPFEFRSARFVIQLRTQIDKVPGFYGFGRNLESWKGTLESTQPPK